MILAKNDFRCNAAKARRTKHAKCKMSSAFAKNDFRCNIAEIRKMKHAEYQMHL